MRPIQVALACVAFACGAFASASAQACRGPMSEYSIFFDALPDIPDAVLLPAPGEISGVHHSQYRADLVLHCMAPGRERPAHAFVVEIQLAPDQDKDFTWPLYVAGVRARERCRVTRVLEHLHRAVRDSLLCGKRP